MNDTTPHPSGPQDGAAGRLLEKAVEERARELSGKPEPPPSVSDRLLAVGLDRLPEKPELGLLEEVLRALPVQAKGLDPLGVQLLREGAVDQLKAKGVGRAKDLVETALRGLGGAGGDGLQGQAINLREPEPWPDPVDGAALLDDIEALICRFVVLPAGAAPAIALWIVHSYTLEAAQHAPRLAIVSPQKQCGKTTLMSVIGCVVARSLLASNVSPAAVFRVIEAARPTLLIDEGDSFLREKEELRGILNSGHTRAAAFVLRTVGDSHELRRFSTWGALAVALIGRLPATLEDRSIHIDMRRRRREEQVERLPDNLDAETERLRRQAARWSHDWIEDLRRVEPAVPPELDDRARDNWRPLLAIAEAAGGRWPTRAFQAALTLSARRDEAEDSIAIGLLRDLRDLFASRNVDRISSEDAIKTLTEREDGPWREYRRGKPLTQRQLAALLRPFDVAPRTIKLAGGQTAKGYRLEDLRDSIDRYLSRDTPRDPSLRNQIGGATTYGNSDPSPNTDGLRIETDVSAYGKTPVTQLRIETPNPVEEEDPWEEDECEWSTE